MDTETWLKPGFDVQVNQGVHVGGTKLADLKPPQAVKRRCTGTNKAGNPCSMPPRLDAETCLVHSQTPTERSEQAKQASAKSIAVRQSRIEKRLEASEAAKLSLTERLTRDVAVEADAIISALVGRAKDGDMRAQGIIWERLEGKVTDHIAIDGNAPAEMALDDLVAWLSTSVDSA